MNNVKLNEAIRQLKYYQSRPYVPTVKTVCDIALEVMEALQHEVKKIPQICPQKPCYFDMTAEGRDADFMQELVDGHCMRICPKWKEKWGT